MFFPNTVGEDRVDLLIELLFDGTDSGVADPALALAADHYSAGPSPFTGCS